DVIEETGSCRVIHNLNTRGRIFVQRLYDRVKIAGNSSGNGLDSEGRRVSSHRRTVGTLIATTGRTPRSPALALRLSRGRPRPPSPVARGRKVPCQPTPRAAPSSRS